MRLRYMVWTGNFLAFAVLTFGVWRIIGCMPGMPGYKLLVGMTALTGIVWNHFRWWKIAGIINEPDIAGRIDYLIVVNYLILLLVLALLDFPR